MAARKEQNETAAKASVNMDELRELIVFADSLVHGDEVERLERDLLRDGTGRRRRLVGDLLLGHSGLQGEGRRGLRLKWTPARAGSLRC